MTAQRLFDVLPVRVAQALVDVVVFAACFATAYVVRFEGSVPEQFLGQMLVLLPYVALARLAVNSVFGVYRAVWRYVGMREALRFARAIAVVTAVLLALRLFFPSDSLYVNVPIGVIVLEGLLSFITMTGVRFLRRMQHERSIEHERSAVKRKKTLLVGAGEGGLALAREAGKSPELGLEVVGFLDDDPGKKGLELHGARIIGPLDQLQQALAAQRPEQVYITTGRIPANKILAIADACREANITLRIVPSLYEILGNGVAARALREVRIQDVLSREPVRPSLSIKDLKRVYGGRSILVTGAGGSIGSELCRQLLALEPRSLVLVERDENNLFQVNRLLNGMEISDRHHQALVDICDVSALEQVFRDLKPEVVFHAAAYKHVPVMETFPASAVKNNLVATRQLAEMASRHGVESFVMISTDKAVNPSSVMGATKRLAEVSVQVEAEKSNTHFSCVRFGNVLGSRGSVIGIFKEQIKRGGPVTVTHADATRYFMTVEEAVNLVLQAGTLGERGEVFMLDMGEPVRILDLARQMIRLSGFSEFEIPIEIVGLRPGEKLFEELSLEEELVSPTALRKVFRVRPVTFDVSRLSSQLSSIARAASNNDHASVRKLLGEMGIRFRSPEADQTEPPPTKPDPAPLGRATGR